MADIPFFMQSQNITGVAEIKLKAEVEHECGPKITECSCNNVALTVTFEAFYFWFLWFLWPYAKLASRLHNRGAIELKVELEDGCVQTNKYPVSIFQFIWNMFISVIITHVFNTCVE